MEVKVPVVQAEVPLLPELSSGRFWNARLVAGLARGGAFNRPARAAHRDKFL